MKISLGQYIDAVAIVKQYHKQLEEEIAKNNDVNPVYTIKLLEDQYFNFRTAKRLEKENILTVGDLVKYSREDLLKLKDLGKLGVSRIEGYLDSLSVKSNTDLQLGMEL